MFEHPTGNKPKKVILVGCGPTMQDYVSLRASAEAEVLDFDEVWGINLASQALRTDMTFQMDDYVSYASRKGAANRAAFARNMDEPVITSVPRPECPTAVAYPLGDVLMIPGAKDYLNHTAAYAIAYALLIGVKELIIFGCDYISRDKPYNQIASAMADKPARYMACAAYWTGLAAARGMEVIVTPNSAFLDSDTFSKFYGYLVQPVIHRDDAFQKPTVVETDEQETKRHG